MVAKRNKKEKDLKKAFREIGDIKGITRKKFHTITDYELLVHMQNNKIGTWWITEASIGKTRCTMPLQYRTNL